LYLIQPLTSDGSAGFATGVPGWGAVPFIVAWPHLEQALAALSVWWPHFGQGSSAMFSSLQSRKDEDFDTTRNYTRPAARWRGQRRAAARVANNAAFLPLPGSLPR